MSDYGLSAHCQVKAKRSVVAVRWVVIALVALLSGGCASVRDYFCNGFKVGPNYCQPAAPVAPQWLDTADPRLRADCNDLNRWWTVFNDPQLTWLVHCAYQQNLTLRQAGCRILEARAQVAITRGELFPQSQTNTGSYHRTAASLNPPGGGGVGVGRFNSVWTYGFNLNWELDFWGRFRRAIEASEDLLDASVEDYDDVLVTLLADVASNYVQIRTSQERIALLKANVELQRGVLQLIENRLAFGYRVTELDAAQARSNLAQTEAAIPQQEIALRQANNRLSILMGMPPTDLIAQLGDGPIPLAPSDVGVGMPANLLLRRPDVRSAERRAAAQAEEIGIAQAELYPAISINGNLGYQARQLRYLYTQDAFTGSFGPSFQWNILNYGRLVNHVRFQNARFCELVAAYQQTVLDAGAEAENGIIQFLNAQQRARLLEESVRQAQIAVKIVVAQYEVRAVDFNRYATIQQNLVVQQDLHAQSRGEIAQGLILIYRALGGGWQIRCETPEGVKPLPAGYDGGLENIPSPAPNGAPAAGENRSKPPTPSIMTPTPSVEPAPARKEMPEATRMPPPPRPVPTPMGGGSLPGGSVPEPQRAIEPEPAPSP